METVYFNGFKFSRHSDKDYFRCAKLKERLHRYVWKYYNGDIPDGYDVHHIDFDKGNNDISNLQLLPSSEHQMIHSTMLTEEQREWRRNNLNTNARPKAIEWHKSDSGIKWHSEHIKQQRTSGSFKRELVCTFCGKHYIGELQKIGGNTFCSNNCKAAYRRKMKIDDIPTTCLNCGKTFMSHKKRTAKTCCRSCTNHYRWLVKKGILNEGEANTENR